MSYEKVRLLSLAAAVALLLSALPVSAAAADLLIPRVRTGDAPFADTRTAWCADSVQTVYETGLMAGKTATRFDATGSLTYAHITVITARLHELLHGGDGVFPAPAAGEAWYAPAAAYLISQVSGATAAGDYVLTDLTYFMDDQANTPCDRFDFVWYLAAVLPENTLGAINSISLLPDTDDEDVLRFYNAGILTGSDAYGTFNGLSNLNRGQAAAMLARIVDRSQRRTFTPETRLMSQALLSLSPQTPVLTINGVTITAEAYAAALVSAIRDAEAEIPNGYRQYYADWLDDDSYLDSFVDYLREKHGISAQTAWNTVGAEGLPLAQQARRDALAEVTMLALLVSNQSSYPLSSAQRTQILRDLPAYRAYGLTDTYAEFSATCDALLDNLSARRAVAPAQVSAYLDEHSTLYGQHMSFYRGEASWWNSDAETLSAIQASRAKIVNHLNDADYLAYCLEEYSDECSTTPELLSYANLTEANQATLRALAPGQLSPVLTEPDCYLVVVKLNPTGNQDVADQISLNEAWLQLADWAETAQVTPAAAYSAVDVVQVSTRLNALNLW